MNQICSANAVQAAAPIESALHNMTCNSLCLSDTLTSIRSSAMQALNERISSLDSEIAALSAPQTAYRHLLTIPGVGPLIAAAFISEVDAKQFSSGRELSAWCVLERDFNAIR